MMVAQFSDGHHPINELVEYQIRKAHAVWWLVRMLNYKCADVKQTSAYENVISLKV